MKTLLILALACGSAAAASSAENGHARAAAAASASSPGADGEWTEDYAAALATARATQRPLLIDFTGSDWCGWCMRLDREVFGTSDFKQWAGQHVVLVKADFPRTRQLPAAVAQQNDELLQKFGIEGFPTIVVIDAGGAEIARSGYRDGGAKAWIADLAEKARIHS